MVAGDGNHNLIGDGGDLHVAVVHHEGDLLEVTVGVLELGGGQTHHGLACVRPAGGSGAGEADAALRIQRIADARHGVAGDGVCVSVVNMRIMVAGDGNHNLIGDGGDLHVAVVHHEGDLLEVTVGVLELGGGQTHHSLACVRPAGGSGAGELEAVFRIQRIVGLHGVAGDGVWVSVVDLRVTFAGDGNHDPAVGVDGQGTGGNLRNNVLFRGIHSTLSALVEVHGILSGVGARAGSGYALEGGQGAHGFGSKAGHGVLAAIVSPGIRVCRQFYILIIVEDDDILPQIGADGQSLAFFGHGGIALDFLRG